MRSRQIFLLILLIVFSSAYPNDVRNPRATDEMKVPKTPDTIPVLDGHIPDYISFDAEAPIIDNSEDDEEDEEGLDDMESEGSAGAMDHNFLGQEFNPENVPFVPKPMSPTHGGFIKLQEEMRNLTYNPENKTVRFFCDIVGQPIPNITWYHNNMPIKRDDPSGRFFIKYELWGSILRIKKPTQKDLGRYTCTAENPSGKLSTSAWLIPEQMMQKRPDLLTPPQSSWSARNTHSGSESENGFCQVFQSNVCVRYLNGHRVFVSTPLHQTLVEQQISKLISSATMRKWHSNVKDCLGRIMEATCYYHFPICPPPSEERASKSTEASSRRRLCLEDCHVITDGECSSVYKLLLSDTQSQGSTPKLFMNCSGLLPFDPSHPDACLRSGSRPPVPDLIDLIRDPDPEGTQKDFSGYQPQTGQPTTQSPDLLPLFISFGVLILLTLIIILICFVCRRSHTAYSNDVFGGGSRVMRTFCGKAAAVGKKQPGRHMHVPNSVEMKQPIAEINNGCPETTPFVANSYTTATSPNLDRRLSPTQQQYHQYQSPKNVLMIPPPTSPAPPPPQSSYSPFDLANHRAFTQVYSSQVDREMDGGEKQFLMTNSGLFASQAEQLEKQQRQIPSTTSSDPMDRTLQAINYPLCQIKFGDRIGQGVFGPVFAGELQACSDYENSKPTPLVIKTLSPGAPASMQTDFRREANIMAELHHPNLLSIFGVCLQQPPWCMLFETPLYGDLHEVLLAARRSSDEGNWSSTNGVSQTWPRNQTLTESDRSHIAFQVASGMEYLSRNHFIHRDLAARNVTVGENLLCKITDLGLARDSYAMDYYRVPAANNLLLPVRWMPIEAILCSRFSVESDVWAFGVLLWEIWTDGMRPYHLYSDAEVIDLVQSRYLLPCPHNCSPQVYTLMVDCWDEIGMKRPSFQDILSRLSMCHQEVLASNGIDNTFPTSRTMDLTSTNNTCSHSGDSGKTNSTDVSTERPASQRISSVPMPIMASLEGALDMTSSDINHRQSTNFSLGPRPATTGANSSNAKPFAFSPPLTSVTMNGGSSPLYSSDATHAV
nr:tyrosine protein kinase transmembrane receptor [Hymenolepis microstoma]